MRRDVWSRKNWHTCKPDGGVWDPLRSDECADFLLNAKRRPPIKYGAKSCGHDPANTELTKSVSAVKTLQQRSPQRTISFKWCARSPSGALEGPARKDSSALRVSDSITERHHQREGLVCRPSPVTWLLLLYYSVFIIYYYYCCLLLFLITV